MCSVCYGLYFVNVLKTLFDINYRSLNPDISGDKAIIEHNFIPNFALQNEQREDVLITIFYFVFTTLTTVGLGDYYPVGD